MLSLVLLFVRRRRHQQSPKTHDHTSNQLAGSNVITDVHSHVQSEAELKDDKSGVLATEWKGELHGDSSPQSNHDANAGFDRLPERTDYIERVELHGNSLIEKDGTDRAAEMP